MDNAERFQNFVLGFNANFWFNSFVKEFDTLIKNNRSIEESPVIKMVDGVIADPQKSFYITIPKGTILYRARQVKAPQDYNANISGIKASYNEDGSFSTFGLDQYSSKEPPLGIPKEGRNNISGMSYLYLAEDVYTACSEIRPSSNSCISVAKFELMRDISVIDFSTDRDVKSLEALKNELQLTPAVMITKIMEQFAKLSTDDQVYQVTQYISDRIRKTGVDGIKYMSSLTHGKDITLFHSHESIVRFQESKLIYSWVHEYKFLDLESASFVPWIDHPDTWTAEKTEELRKEISTGLINHTKQGR